MGFALVVARLLAVPAARPGEPELCVALAEPRVVGVVQLPSPHPGGAARPPNEAVGAGGAGGAANTWPVGAVVGRAALIALELCEAAEDPALPVANEEPGFIPAKPE